MKQTVWAAIVSLWSSLLNIFQVVKLSKVWSCSPLLSAQLLIWNIGLLLAPQKPGARPLVKLSSPKFDELFFFSFSSCRVNEGSKNCFNLPTGGWVSVLRPLVIISHGRPIAQWSSEDLWLFSSTRAWTWMLPSCRRCFQMTNAHEMVHCKCCRMRVTHDWN